MSDTARPATPATGGAGRDCPDPALRDFLAGVDASCPGCGYNLRGLGGRHCPECNQPLVLRVGLEFPRQGAFVAGLVGWALTLGFCGLLLVWVVMMNVKHRGGGPQFREMLPLILGAIVSGAGLAVWLRARARLARLDSSQRAWVVAAAWVVGMASPMWFMLTVR